MVLLMSQKLTDRLFNSAKFKKLFEKYKNNYTNANYTPLITLCKYNP